MVKARRRKDKKQIFDAVTELAGGPGARVGGGRGAGQSQRPDVSGIVTENHYLPSSPVVIRLLEIRADPISHFLPTRITPAGTFFSAAPPGLAPELAELFMRPVQSLAAPKRRGEAADQPSSKRPRVEGSVVGDDEVEQARRASVAPSLALGSEILGRESVAGDLEFGDTTGAMEDFQLPEFEMAPGEQMELERARSKSAAPSELSRLTTPPADDVPMQEGQETYADMPCQIAEFDERTSSSQSGESGASQSEDGKGYSKNTVKALTIIRRELGPVTGEEHPEDKVMSFKRMSQKVCVWYAYIWPRPLIYPVGDPPCSGCFLLRASGPRHSRLCQALADGSLREHRGAREGQAMGASASWFCCAFCRIRVTTSLCSTICSYFAPATGFGRTIHRVRLRALAFYDLTTLTTTDDLSI